MVHKMFAALGFQILEYQLVHVENRHVHTVTSQDLVSKIKSS